MAESFSTCRAVGRLQAGSFAAAACGEGAILQASATIASSNGNVVRRARESTLGLTASVAFSIDLSPRWEVAATVISMSFRIPARAAR